MSILEMFNLKGKHAIVTGGGRGLGKGMAEGLCEAGATVVLIGSSDSVFKTVDEFAQKGYNAYAIKGDLSKPEKIHEIFIHALELLDDRIDILVNNAGVQRRYPCEKFPIEEWNLVLQVNLNAVFVLCQLAGNKMIEQGYGKIINVASMLSFFGGYTVPAYAASKGGVAQLTKALANEWAKKNVHVNAIAPGYMDTDMNEKLVNDEYRNAEILARIPIGRWGTKEDVKGLTIFLASPASDYINGAIVPIDGGYLSR